ncbi:hypothetical protein ACFX16_018821 [Malus domestica]
MEPSPRWLPHHSPRSKALQPSSADRGQAPPHLLLSHSPGTKAQTVAPTHGPSRRKHSTHAKLHGMACLLPPPTATVPQPP